MIFKNRAEAGMKLAESMKDFGGKDVVVLGIPRGGVVVAKEIAKELGAPMDIIVTKKIGAPGEPEFALGAVTQEGDVIMDRQVAESLGASREYLDDQIAEKRKEVSDRMRRLRGDAPYPTLEGRVVLIVDDGIATGSSMEAAVMSVKKRKPKEVVVAVPVAPRDAIDALTEDGTKVVCLESPGSFLAIGEFYRDFGQVEDTEVVRILQENLGRTDGDPSRGFTP